MFIISAVILLLGVATTACGSGQAPVVDSASTPSSSLPNASEESALEGVVFQVHRDPG